VSELRFESAGVLGSGIVGALFLTTRVERIGREHYDRFREAGQPVMFVFWHGQLLPLVHYHRHEGIVVLVSEHDDGEYITRVLLRNGFEAVRGSSTRGGTKGLKGLVRAARQGRDLAVTPDGPKGPRGVFKPGALVAAQVAGLPVVPVALTASAGYRFRSWDGFLLPRPFSTITIEYLEPRVIEREASRGELERLADEIGAQLNAREDETVAHATAQPSDSRGDGTPA
jgi:lysophospholipid acyltransferase (LPLAT)-like uncharacterized protein